MAPGRVGSSGSTQPVADSVAGKGGPPVGVTGSRRYSAPCRLNAYASPSRPYSQSTRSSVPVIATSTTATPATGSGGSTNTESPM